MTRSVALVVLALAAMACLAGCTGAASAGPDSSSRSGSRSVLATQAVRTPATVGVPVCPSTAPTVRTASTLVAALATARPGSVIVLAPGRYSGRFTATGSGTAAAPITLCGPASAILDGGSTSTGYVLHLASASWWRVLGITVRDGQKGVVVDDSQHSLIAGLTVTDIGDEGIHLRDFSSDDTVEANHIHGTGLHKAKYGEGIYVGSAQANWCSVTACKPDASNHNLIENNVITDTTAENIDIKEGTTGGTISGNQLSGVGMVASAAKGWVNVKGNSWLVRDNTGTGSYDNGFEVHQVLAGWGLDNTFVDNHASVDGAGYGYYVQSKRLGTVVACSNTESGASGGLSTIACSG